MSESVTVEFASTVQLTGGDGVPLGLRSRVVARVFPLPKGRSRKPVISLVADDWRGAAEQVGMWFEHGRPTMEEAKAEAAP